MMFNKGGKSLILCHTSSDKFGFVPKSKFVFRYEKDSHNDDCYQMDDAMFKNWFYQMLRHLEESGIIVIDNASYHSMVVDNTPKFNASKFDIYRWLNDIGIDFMPIEALVELREKVKLVTPMEK